MNELDGEETPCLCRRPQWRRCDETQPLPQTPVHPFRRHAMFELLAFVAVLAVCGVVAGALFVAFSMAKFAFTVVLLPLKLLFLPVLAVLFIVKMSVLVALVATVVAVMIAIIVPLIIVAAIVAVPIAVIGVLA